MPMSRPPTSNSDETPNAPNDSNFPYPKGKRSVGGRNANETVANVKKSETKSVRLCTASADKAASANQYVKYAFGVVVELCTASA